MYQIIARIAIGAAVGYVVGYGGHKGYKYLKNRKRRKDVAKNAEKATETPPAVVERPQDSDLFTLALSTAVAVDYDPKWENGTGYFNHAIHFMPAHAENHPGTLYRSKDPLGRNILIIPIAKKVGSVVVFERHAITSVDQEPVYKAHYPTVLHPFIKRSNGDTLRASDLQRIIGDIVDGGAAGGVRDTFLEKVKVH